VRRIPERPLAGVEYCFGNLGDPAAVDRAVAGAETVIHVGAAMKGGWPEHRGGTVVGTENVIAACKRHAAKQLVHISSMSVIDWAGSAGNGPVSEAAALEPRPDERGAYTRAKLEAEQLVVAAAATGLRCVILRPGQIFGGGIPLINGAVARNAGGRWLALHDRIDDVVDVYSAARACVASTSQRPPALRATAPLISGIPPPKIWPGRRITQRSPVAAGRHTSCSASSFARVYAPRSSGRGSSAAASLTGPLPAEPAQSITDIDEMCTSCFAACRLHAAMTFSVPTTVPPRCSGQPPFHRGADVDHGLGAGDRAIDRRGIAEVAEAILDAGKRALRDPAHERTDLTAVRDQPVDDRPAQKPRGAGHHELDPLGARELGDSRRVVGLGHARDLLDPLDDHRGILDRHRWWLAGGEPAVEVVTRNRAGLDTPGPPCARTSTRRSARRSGAAANPRNALISRSGRLRQRRRRALCRGTSRNRSTRNTPFGAVDDQLRLHRLGVPRQLELAEAALAAHDRAPLVEREVRVAAERSNHPRPPTRPLPSPLPLLLQHQIMRRHDGARPSRMRMRVMGRERWV